MHVHILGIGGTFMGGLALIARAAGHRVTGCDTGVYPPMSTQLAEQGIDFTEGFDTGQLALKPDLFIVGNVVKRGMPVMEEILNRGLPYTSGPQWLGQHILQDQHVLAVAGTHGKTTTSSMLAWILERAGMQPNFLIGGIASDFGVSARFRSSSSLFVIEADEYDTAFFDKRSKFVHYRARTAILNNLEFDHADIFPDLAAIETQFHHLVRTLPSRGTVIRPAVSEPLDRVLARGCWTPATTFGDDGEWQAHDAGPGDAFQVVHDGCPQGTVEWALTGQHNRLNALAAIAAASRVGVPPADAIQALCSFQGVKRRMEYRGEVAGVSVYDDFAHHPTAIATTLQGARRRWPDARLIAVLEPRSNTMKLGTMAARLPEALEAADRVFCFGQARGDHALGWSPAEVLAPLGSLASAHDDIDTMVQAIAAEALADDIVVIMSNGSFGGIHQKLLDALVARQAG